MQASSIGDLTAGILLLRVFCMVLWMLAFACGFAGFGLLHVEFRTWMPRIRSCEDDGVIEAGARLHEIQETLEAGVVPSQEKWENLRALSAPWGPLLSDGLLELRQSGASILPTLRRLRTFAQDYREDLQSAKARTSQALVQAAVCTMIVPVFSLVLYLLLPGVSDHPSIWAMASGIGVVCCLLGTRWLLGMAERARWGGLPRCCRSWVLGAFTAGERFLALVRSGVTPDEAWRRSVMAMRTHASELAVCWGASIWDDHGGPFGEGEACALIAAAGLAMKKAIQTSLIDGYPCMEKIETLLAALRADWRGRIEKEITLLSTRALKPLFLCVAPSLMGLLAFALWLAWQEAIG